MTAALRAVTSSRHPVPSPSTKPTGRPAGATPTGSRCTLSVDSSTLSASSGPLGLQRLQLLLPIGQGLLGRQQGLGGGRAVHQGLQPRNRGLQRRDPRVQVDRRGGHVGAGHRHVRDVAEVLQVGQDAGQRIRRHPHHQVGGGALDPALPGPRLLGALVDPAAGGLHQLADLLSPLAGSSTTTEAMAVVTTWRSGSVSRRAPGLRTAGSGTPAPPPAPLSALPASLPDGAEQPTSTATASVAAAVPRKRLIARTVGR